MCSPWGGGGWPSGRRRRCCGTRWSWRSSRRRRARQRRGAHRQPAAAAVGTVGFGAVQDPVAVQGDLTGPHLQGDRRLAPGLGVAHRLEQHLVFFLGAVVEGELGVVVRAGDHVHRRVADVGVVDRQLGRDHPAGRERPVGGVLVPADPLGIARKLGEQVAVTQHHGVAQQVRDDVDGGKAIMVGSQAGELLSRSSDRALPRSPFDVHRADTPGL